LEGPHQQPMSKDTSPSVVVDQSKVSDPLIGVRLANIEIVRSLDAGGMGTVYLGINREIDKQYAIKVASQDTHPSLQGRALQEAKALSKLDHPNIVQVFDAATLPDGRLAIVMPMLSGSSLARHVGQQADGSCRRLPLADALLIGLQLARGLGEAHRHGFVHRDLKPANVFLTQRDTEVEGFRCAELKLLDFGLVRVGQAPALPVTGGAATSGAGPAPTIAGGTPQYVSPEQATGSPHIDGRADLYSLGVLLFQVLAGRLPFVAMSGQSEEAEVAALLRAHLLEPAPRLSTIAEDTPRALDDLVAQLLEKRPDARPQSASEVETRLSEVLRALPPEVGGGTAAPKSRALQAFGVLAVAAAAGTVLWLAPWNEAPAEVPDGPPVAVVAPANPESLPVAVKPENPMTPGTPVKPDPVASTAVTPPEPAVPGPQKKPVKKPPRLPRAPAGPCVPDDRWRSAMLANLNELGRLAEDNARSYARFKAGEMRLSPLVRTAASPKDCAQANAMFEDLKSSLSPR
jgi:tRNA A-37 threonylcarbamoyl transferase component Bud32